MKSFYITDSGRVRSHNEDSVTIVKNETGEHLITTSTAYAICKTYHYSMDKLVRK